jgi:hypothetical protein
LKAIALGGVAIWVLLIAAAHNLAIVIGGAIAVAIVLGMLVAALRLVVAHSQRSLSRAPSGTRFAGHGSVLLRSLDSSPRWDELRSAAQLGSVRVGIEVHRTGLVLRPLSNRLSASALAIEWQEVSDLTASPSPGKPFLGSVALVLSDGASLRANVRDYRGSSKAHAAVRDQ